MIVGEHQRTRNVIARHVDRRNNADLPADGTGCDELSDVVIEVAQFTKNARRVCRPRECTMFVMATHDRWGSKGLNAATGGFNRPPSISSMRFGCVITPVTSFTRPFAIPAASGKPATSLTVDERNTSSIRANTRHDVDDVVIGCEPAIGRHLWSLQHVGTERLPLR